MKNKGRMVDLKRSEEDRKAETTAVEPMMREPDYPYGLSVRFDQASLSKLELDAENCEKGDELEFMSRAIVKEVGKIDREGSDARRWIELQITHISIGDDDDDDSEGSRVVKANRRYSGSKGE